MAQHVQLRQSTQQRRTVQEVLLDGVRIRLRATYSKKTDRWYLSIYNTSDQQLVGGIACVPGIDLLKPYKHLAIPQGELWCQSNDREPPTFVTLDTTARVLYR